MSEYGVRESDAEFVRGGVVWFQTPDPTRFVDTTREENRGRTHASNIRLKYDYVSFLLVFGYHDKCIYSYKILDRIYE
jgi:hypothetical protein